MSKTLDQLTGTNDSASANRRFAILENMEKVSEYLAKGYTIIQISKILFPEQRTTSTAYSILRRLCKRAKKRAELNFEFYVNQKEEQYNTIMRECWDAYEFSKTNHKGDKIQPNVVYLDRILACLEAMRKLRGLDKKVDEPKQDNKGLNWDSLTAGRQLSSITVSLNGNEVAKPNNQNAAMVLKDEIDARIEELERRAEKRASMLDDDAPSAKVTDASLSKTEPVKSAQSNKVIIVKAMKPKDDASE